MMENIRIGKRFFPLGLVLALTFAANAAQVQLPPGNGMWIKPSSTPVVGSEAALVSALKTHNIKHIFLWTIAFSTSEYASFVPFIQQAHANGMTVHVVCATKPSITSGGQPTSTLLASALDSVITHNANHPDACFDGVQIDIEGVSGSTLTNLVSNVQVPETLVFSAAVQPNEFFANVESYYAPLLQNTDLDMLVPMFYTMDGITYNGGNASFSFSLSKIQTKTAQVLSILPANGKLMAGIAAYDRQFFIDKSNGKIDPDNTEGFSQPAWSTSSGSSYSVPRLVASGKPLVTVTNRSTIGVSIYRFDYDSTSWLDVIEMSPNGLRQSLKAADQGRSGNSRYVGNCTWLYHTIFDTYSGRPEALLNDDVNYPNPKDNIQLVSFQAGIARLRVTLTNTNPTEHILGSQASAGIHLRLQGATFVTADAGTFHGVEAFNSSGISTSVINGTQIIELHRSFFENPFSQSASSGEIVINAPTSFTLRYRSWMMDKDSICNDVGTAEAYIARSPDDVHYSSPSKFLAYATFTTNFVVPSASGARYASTVLSDAPVAYYRFNEPDIVTVPFPHTARNSGTLGVAAEGAAAGDSATEIVAKQSGALSDPTNTAFRFPGNPTNHVVVPFKPAWNMNSPFSVELWLKGGTTFSCPIASTEFDKRGWVIYQGNSAQTSGNGWWFRLYQQGSTFRINAQINMAVNTNLWYHIAGVFDGANVRLYTNGVLANSSALTTTYLPNTNTSYPLIFGARSESGAYPYDGLMDEVAFYTNALSANQIAAHYAAATTNATGYAAQILAHHPPGYWQLNDALLPPVATNSGSAGFELNGSYLHSSSNAPGLVDFGFAGLESSNRVVQLSGTNGQITIPPLNLNTNTVTFQCWLKRDGNQQNYAGLIMHRNSDGSGACGLGFHGTNNHLGYYWNDVSATYLWDSGLEPPDGQWVFAALAISPNRAVMDMYDGTSWSAATNFVANTSQAFAGITRIGCDGGTNRWFAGSIDEVAIFNKTLTQNQLLNHALAGVGGRPIFTTPPVSRSVQAGESAYFNATVIGDMPLSFVWQKNGADIFAATNLSFAIPAADYTDSGRYQMLAINTNGTALSPSATLAVMPPPSVTNLIFRTSSEGAQSSLELIWPTGLLYSADDVTGPWMVLSNALPPYYRVIIDMESSEKFFRIK